jgi:putative ABC transport system permease protein
MLRLALETMRARRHGFVGAFVALAFAVVVVTACGMLVETGTRAAAPVQRYAAVPVVVAANRTIPVKVNQQDESVESFLLPEQARIPAALAERVAAVDGVQAVLADRSIPTTLATADGRLLAGPDGGPVVGHGWSSAALTPYGLAAGRAPSAPGEVVLDATLAAQGDVGVGAQVRITSTDGTSSYVVVGLARPPRGRGWQGAVFVTDAPLACPPPPRASTRSGWVWRMVRTPSRSPNGSSGWWAGGSARTPAATEARRSPLRPRSKTRILSHLAGPSARSRRC